ncbi:hypothetical protein M3205_20690 [Cytobacillus firmus]|uniref:hypothetical protein n=2 Tax=Cytobacillus TaxID=2675230 RepID=UPI00203BC1A6|nr:hypothetical protein [Cytobacillus firmus]MCM3708082.1 hypothetical protein [Cytobacillus firmus]
MEKIYLLDKFLTVQYLKELVKNNGLKIVNPPPQELEETLKYYKQRLRSSLDEPYIMNDHQKAKVRIPLNQDEYYCMEWNMTKLKYLIKRAQIKKVEVTEKIIASSLPAHCEDDNDDNWTLLSFPPITSKYILAEGNKENIRTDQKIKDAYLIQPQVHLQAVTRSIYRNLFAIHFNYSLICSYVAGQLTLKEVEERVLPVL